MVRRASSRTSPCPSRRGRFRSEYAQPSAGSVVGGERVLAPVVGEVAPDGVDVVRPVLRVVVLEQERRAADRVVVASTWLGGPGPAERHVVQAVLGEAAPGRGGHVVAVATQVVADERVEGR